LQKILRKLIVTKDKEVQVCIPLLQKQTAINTIIWEIINPYNFTSAQVNEVVKLLEASNGSYVKSETHKLIVNRGWLLISSIQNKESVTIIIEKNDGNIEFDLGNLFIERSDLIDLNNLPKNKEIALLNAAEIVFPLILRKWKISDYFYPLGMDKKKKAVFDTSLFFVI
jgi:tRNA(Ile)-lysidine synthase